MKKNIFEHNYFICPDCRQRLGSFVEGELNSCKSCGAQFSLQDGIFDLFPNVPFANIRSIDFAELYQFFGNLSNKEDTERIRRDATISMVDGGRILEIGCASGMITELLASKGEVFAGDISMSYLQKVKKRVPESKVIHLDAHKLPFEDLFFDNVLMTDVLEHVLVPFRAIEEVYRVLKPTGKFILGVPNIFSLSNLVKHLKNTQPQNLLQYNNTHISFYDPAGLFQLLAANGFSIKHYHPVCPLSIFRNKLPSKIVAVLDFLLYRVARYFSQEILVISEKIENKFWYSIKLNVSRIRNE